MAEMDDNIAQLFRICPGRESTAI